MAPTGSVLISGPSASVYALYADVNGDLVVESTTGTVAAFWLTDSAGVYWSLSVDVLGAVDATSGTPGTADVTYTNYPLPTPDATIECWLQVRTDGSLWSSPASVPTTIQPAITSQRIGLQLDVSASLHLETAVVDPLSESPQLRVRSLSQLAVDMPHAIPIFGRPHVPAIWVQGTPTVTLREGASHMRVVPDVPATTSHPAKGAGTPTYTWLATQSGMTPSGNGIFYWPEAGGGPHLVGDNVSSGDRPSVAFNDLYASKVTRTYFGTNGRKQSYTGIEFVPEHINAYSLDLGSITQPFSFIFVGVINSYPTRKYGHYFLDAYDGLSYRSLMLYQLNSCILCTRHTVEDGVYVRAPHDFVPQPRMFFGIFNGANSYIGHYDVDTKNVVKGKVDVKPGSKFLIGRRQGYVETDLASHMTLFEIRYYAKALTMAQLDEDYKQIAATYKFGIFAGNQGQQ